MRLERPRVRRRLISLTPLIDVVMILLVFFMLASSFVQWQVIALDTPALPSLDSGDVQGAVLVRIHADGQLDINGLAVTGQALEDRLRSLLDRDPAQSVLVQPRRGVDLQTLVSVLDRLHRLGVERLGVAGGTA